MFFATVDSSFRIRFCLLFCSSEKRKRPGDDVDLRLRAKDGQHSKGTGWNLSQASVLDEVERETDLFAVGHEAREVLGRLALQAYLPCTANTEDYRC
jgi:hypothetical protein